MQTIGQRLKAEREEKRLTLEKVFEATRIRVQHLQALEADDHSRMPSPVQARGYLRNYAAYLGLDVDQVLEELRALHAQETSTQVIGPADEMPSVPQPENKLPEPTPAAPTLEVSDGIADRPVEEIPATSPSVTIPIKPKPGRRKKADASTDQPDAASAEPTTRRRGRKKVEAEIVPPLETQPEQVPAEESVSTPAAPVEFIPERVRAEEPVVSVEPLPEPTAEQKTDIQSDAQPRADVNDTASPVWRTWLGRLGSILSARGRRRTLVQKEAPVVENEPVEAAIISTASDTPEAEAEKRPAESSSEILKEIGQELRSRRELLSLHFDEVERNTHVKAHYLSALENGALDELPSTVHTRGMLSNYATFLDLDVDALLLRFADALQARHRERNPQKPKRKQGQPIISMPPVRSFIAGDMIFGIGIAILLVGFAIWGVSWVMTIQSRRDVQPTAPSISDVLLTSPDPSVFTPTPTFLPVEAFPGEATVTVEIPTLNANAEVQLNLVAVERSYMRVVVDGEVVFDGRVVPGNAYPFEAETQVEVLVGSGAAIRTVYNGRDLGLMGTFGQVVSNIYSSTGIITPTSAPTATATITPTPTNTVPPTATSRFTVTPPPSATTAP